MLIHNQGHIQQQDHINGWRRRDTLTRLESVRTSPLRPHPLRLVGVPPGRQEGLKPRQRLPIRRPGSSKSHLQLVKLLRQRVHRRSIR